jgi:putative two-component system response regulator
MQRLSRAAEYKDNETGRHVIRVGQISRLLGRAMGMDEERSELLGECAPLHDVGKIGIPDEVLLKPGRLTQEEWDIMRKHCVYGCEILGPLDSKDEAHRLCSDPLLMREMSGSEQLNLARVLALCHHERWDGTGYPFGLSGEDIPLEARIVSVVDVYNALCSDRPYKQAMSPDKAGELIRAGRAPSSTLPWWRPSSRTRRRSSPSVNAGAIRNGPRRYCMALPLQKSVRFHLKTKAPGR